MTEQERQRTRRQIHDIAADPTHIQGRANVEIILVSEVQGGFKLVGHIERHDDDGFYVRRPDGNLTHVVYSNVAASTLLRSLPRAIGVGAGRRY